jgi:hypothetical protein
MAKGKQKKKFRVRTEFTFTGDFIIKAKSRQEAHDLVKKYAGMTMANGIEFDPTSDTSKLKGGVDWDFDPHAEMQITHT